MAKKKASTKKADYDHFSEFEKDASGFEDININTISIPFIRILQDLSPQIKKKKAEYVDGAESGMIINTVNEALYKAPLLFVVGKFERYYIEWKPNRGSFVAQHLPENVETRMNEFTRDEKGKLYNIKSGNYFVETYIYYVLLPDHMEEGVCLITMSSTQIKEAKKLNRALTTTCIPGTKQRALPYFMEWSLSVVEMSNDQGEWWGMKIRLSRFIEREMLANVVKERKALPDKKADLTLIEDRPEATDDGDAKY